MLWLIIHPFSTLLSFLNLYKFASILSQFHCNSFLSSPSFRSTTALFLPFVCGHRMSLIAQRKSTINNREARSVDCPRSAKAGHIEESDDQRSALNNLDGLLLFLRHLNWELTDLSLSLLSFCHILAKISLISLSLSLSFVFFVSYELLHRAQGSIVHRLYSGTPLFCAVWIELGAYNFKKNKSPLMLCAGGGSVLE